MGAPRYWGIGGNPISHSSTPRLFGLVGDVVGLEAEELLLEADSASQFKSKSSEFEGDIWVSITSPLKHSPERRFGIQGPLAVNAVNQLKREDGVWSGYNTDGLGFVSACRYIGLEPDGSTLLMKGGGSAARSIAAAWSSEGGLIIAAEGRRKLCEGPWDYNLVNAGNPDVSVDTDAKPGGENSPLLNSNLPLSINYGRESKSSDFAIIMLAAQHLEAWRLFFRPDLSKRLPTLEELLEQL